MNDKPHDPVNSPAHYQGAIECIACIESALTSEQYVGYLRGNIIKYVFRSGKKGDAKQDYEKAEYYLKKLIATYEPKRTKDTTN